MILLFLIVTSPFWLTYFTISLVYELFKIDFKKNIFDLYDNKTVKSWIIMISDLVFNASAGLFTVVLAFFGLSFAVDIKLLKSTAVNSFVNYDIDVIMFIMVYAIIMATISWYIKKEIKGKL